MKKNFLFTLILISSTLCAQVQTKIQKVVKVLEPQSFYLNGGARNMVGGKSRIGFKIDLPANTVEWYYAFTTAPNKNQEQNLQLDSQIGFLLSTAGIPNNLLNLIKIPTGQGLIDVYLTNRKGYDTFFQKDFFGAWEFSAPNHVIEGSITNTKDGKVRIDDILKGSHFLVVRNTSGYEGINVKLEVVAIVEEIKIDATKWDKKSKDMLFNSAKKDLQKSYPYNLEKVEEISACVVTNVTTNLTPNDIAALAEYELKNLMKKYFKECMEKN